jgi:hypothetical protein
MLPYGGGRCRRRNRRNRLVYAGRNWRAPNCTGQGMQILERNWRCRLGDSNMIPGAAVNQSDDGLTYGSGARARAQWCMERPVTSWAPRLAECCSRTLPQGSLLNRRDRYRIMAHVLPSYRIRSDRIRGAGRQHLRRRSFRANSQKLCNALFGPVL